MQPMWACFGYDEPNYTYMKDGQKLLAELAALSPVPVYVRAHNLLTTGDGTAAFKWGSTNAYTEDKDGKPVYDWKIVDQICDAYIKRGMKPIKTQLCASTSPPSRPPWSSLRASSCHPCYNTSNQYTPSGGSCRRRHWPRRCGR